MNLNTQTAFRRGHSARTFLPLLLDRMIEVNASQTLDSAAGRLVGKMYYGSFLDEALAREESWGFPNNGGEHTFRLRMKPVDMVAFLQIVEEHYSWHDGMPGFVLSVKKRAVEKYPYVDELFSTVRPGH